MSARCVRCRRRRHADRLYLDCLHYEPRAPWWIRAISRVLANLSSAR